MTMKYASGETPMVGDTIFNDMFEYLVTAVGEKGISCTCLQGGNTYSEIVPKDRLRLRSRAPASEPAPVADERYAPGAYYAGRDGYCQLICKGQNRAWHRGDGMGEGIRIWGDAGFTRDDLHLWPITGNVADTIADFLTALTLRADVAMHRVCEPRRDTIPTGSYTVAGSTYDEIIPAPTVDEDAVFKKKIDRERKAREEETAALGRFERQRDIITAAVAAWAPSATVTVDKAIHHSALVTVRCAGECAQFCLGNRMSETGTADSVDVELKAMADAIGARAMGSRK